MKPWWMVSRNVVVLLLLGACGDDSEAPAADVAAGTDTGLADVLEPMDVAAPGEDATSVPDVAPPSDAALDVGVDGALADIGGPDLDASVVTDTSAPPSTGRIPGDTEPCESPAYWPYSVAGGSPLVRVHYRTVAEEPTALEVLAHARFTLPWQIDNLGFRMAPDDGGRCGPDNALDIFLWRDAPSTYTDAVRGVASTWWEDVSPYVVIDAFGELGGVWLASTVTHELNHVLQAADSWYDSPIAYEMTAMYVEDVVHDDDNNYLELIEDFQRSPEFSLDYDDDYETLFMYGACIYLQYLEARFFPTDPTFIGRIWFGMRNRPAENEPDLLDALDAELQDQQSSYIDSVLEFARWRWYTGRRDDARHLPEAGAHPSSAEVAVARTLSAASTAQTVSIANMLLGTTYVTVNGSGDDTLAVSLSGSSAVQWVVQAIPGPDGDDGAFILGDLGESEATLVDGTVTFAITALPVPDGDIDPDTRSQTTYRSTLSIRTAR